MPVDAIATIYIAAATAEVEAVSAVVIDVVIALVGCRTPIVAVVAVLANAVERRPVAVARSRKKYTTTIRACYHITPNSI